MATDVGPVRARAKARARELRDASPREVLAEALAIHGAGDQFLAYEILRAAPRALEAATKTTIERLGAGMDGWAHVDCFASFASGVAWRIGRIDDAVVTRWTKSKDRWWRRAAVVSTVPLNNRARGATAPAGEAARTLAVCRALANDRDDMVVKAISWALRELGKRDAKAVRAFLREQGDVLAPRVRREVATKLETGLKARVVAKRSRR
jgi:3-methyladenine DNA glycosylase AlkD